MSGSRVNVMDSCATFFEDLARGVGGVGGGKRFRFGAHLFSRTDSGTQNTAPTPTFARWPLRLVPRIAPPLPRIFGHQWGVLSVISFSIRGCFAGAGGQAGWPRGVPFVRRPAGHNLPVVELVRVNLIGREHVTHEMVTFTVLSRRRYILYNDLRKLECRSSYFSWLTCTRPEEVRGQREGEIISCRSPKGLKPDGAVRNASGNNTR
jgi:hypothetical protein